MSYDYDVVTVGLGPAGMAVSGIAQDLGLRVASIERERIGGECMNVGCIPSKALLRIAKTRNSVHKWADMALEPAALPKVNDPFPGIQANLKYINNEKNKRMLAKVEMIVGEHACFVDPNTLEVGGRKVTAHRIFLCCGTLPAVPPIKGIDQVDTLNNRNIFNLPGVPQSMIVLGGGAIACEMAQAFARLGTEITIVIRAAKLMKQADPEAMAIIESTFAKEGIEVLRNAKMVKVSQDKAGIHLELGDGNIVSAERLLVATGRTPHFEALKLDRVGIELNEQGYIKVNKHLQTAQPNVYALGDCNGHALFSHAAMHQGMIALMNSMAPTPLRKDYRKYVVPYTVFTEPQVSWVGQTRAELEKKGVEVFEVRSNYGDYGAAIAEHCAVGFVKVLTSKNGRILGAGVVGENSAEMINEWGLAIQKKMNMTDILFLQHSFPSMSFLNKRASEIWMMQKMQDASTLKSIAARAIKF